MRKSSQCGFITSGFWSRRKPNSCSFLPLTIASTGSSARHVPVYGFTCVRSFFTPSNQFLRALSLKKRSKL